MEPTRGACFQYGAQACRLSFPSSYIPSGTPVRDLVSVALSFLFREVSGWLGRGGSPPSFDCYFFLFLPLSTVTSISSLFRP